MKILILDGFTLFQNDLSWEIFSTLGQVTYLTRTSQAEIKHLDPDFDVIITNKCLLNKENLSHFTHLKLVLVAATGFNSVDLKTCTERAIQVSNVPAYGTFSVAQHALAMLLDYSNGVSLHEKSVRKGDWSSNADWCYTLGPIREWHQKKVGIIGMGNIGIAFANMCESLGMQVLYHHTRDLMLHNRTFVDLKTLAQESDVISLHCPLNPSTEYLINASFLDQMKSDAVLINTSRGGLIHTNDLRKALMEHKIAAALLDVLEVEPPVENHPLINLPNAIITPHIAWISQEARKRIIEVMFKTLSAYLNGVALNRVN